MTALHEVPTWNAAPSPPPYRNRDQARTVEAAMRVGMVETLLVLQDRIGGFTVDANEYLATSAVITPLGTMTGFNERLAATTAALQSLSVLMTEQALSFGWREPEPPEQAPVIVAGTDAAPQAAPTSARDLCNLCGRPTQIGLRRALGDGSFVCNPSCEEVAP